jgi:hypothetical protein
MLADHGFALHDRQTTLFGRVGSVQTDATAPRKELFHEIDDRPGYYLGAQARYLDRAVLNVLHYDNRGDPKAQSVELRDMAWKTKFDAVALRVETGSDWTVLVQAMEGDTAIDPFRLLLWEFDSRSAMVAKRWGRHMFAARYDAFEIEFDHRPWWAGSEDGHAWTAAWTFERDDHWRFALEWLRVDSDVPARTADYGEPPFARETKVELSARYTLGGHF